MGSDQNNFTGFPPARPHIAIEGWTWYSFVVLAVILRFWSQRIHRGPRFLKMMSPDDFIMIFAFFTYTTVITTLYLYDGISSRLDWEDVTPQQEDYFGKKLGIINVLIEMSNLATIWSIKACLLVVIFRVTQGARQNLIVKLISVYVAISYIAVLIAFFFGWCRPFSEYFLLNPNVEQCMTWQHYNAFQMSLNVSTDLCILIFPVFIVRKLKMPLVKKVLVMCVFATGLLTITAALCQKIIVWVDPTHPVWIIWGMREQSTAMLVGNFTVLLPLMRKFFQFFGQSLTTFKSTFKSTVNENGTRTEPGFRRMGDKELEVLDSRSKEDVCSKSSTTSLVQPA